MTRAAPIARDYVVSSTYRKEEQAGLKWRRLREQRGSTGDKGVSVREDEEDLEDRASGRASVRESRFLAAVPCASMAKPGSGSKIADGAVPAVGLPPETILAAILEHAALPMRWEPLNVATQHRGIPSGGGAFGAELILIARHRDGLARFRHMPLDGALKHEGRSLSSSAILAGADLAFVIVGNLASYVDPYGEFSPCLAGLECGILEAQLSALCRAYGWKAETLTRHDFRAASEALGLDHWSRIPAILVRVTGPGAGEAVMRCRWETLSSSELAPPVSAADDYPRMRELIETIVNEPAPPCPLGQEGPEGVSATGSAAAPPAGLLELIRRRSSGLTADMARQDGRIPTAVLAALATEIAALHSIEGAADLAGVRLSLTVVATASGNGEPFPFDLDLRDGRLSPAAEPTKHWSQLTFTIGVDDVAEERRSGSRSFLLNHLAAGALAQRIGLAAAAQGLFARPLRGYSESAANLFLGLEYRAILQVACGIPRQANPAYDLRWW